MAFYNDSSMFFNTTNKVIHNKVKPNMAHNQDHDGAHRRRSIGLTFNQPGEV